MAKRVQSKRLEEFEPPEKKLVNEKDILIKQLAKKQSNTKITLESHQVNEKVFERSSPVISITNFHSGECSISKLQQVISKTSELATWKAAGLCNEDILIYKDFKDGIEVLFKKHPNYEKHLLMERISSIEKTLTTHEEIEAQKVLNKCIDDINNEKPVDTLPHPMDGLNDLKTELESKIALSNLTDTAINQIRRKARKLQNRLDIVERKQILPENSDENITVNCNENNSLRGKSKWDVKTETVNNKSKIEKNKVYDCKQQNLYTIKHGEIVRLDSVNNFECSGEKISLDDIKKISKFENYTEGNINNTLYIKNLSKVTDQNLKFICMKYGNIIDTNNVEIKVMTGKMKGQAFISFADPVMASSVLNKINGLIVNGKPIIVQYGKKIG